MENQFTLKKTLIHISIFILLTVIAMWTLLGGQDLKLIFIEVKRAIPIYLILGAIFAFLFTCGEATNIKILLKILGYKASFFKTLKYALTGFFFSSITPSSSGGQPMQVYVMKKDNIEISHSSLILLTELACFQTITLILSVFSVIWIFIHKHHIHYFIKILAIVGICFNGLLLIFLILAIFSKKFANFFTKCLSFIFNKLPFIKDETREKLTVGLINQMKEYHQCSKLLKSDKKVVLKLFFITTIQILCQFSVPYMVYLALGQHGKTFFDILILQSFVYAASSFVPLPGAVGISEKSFLNLFSHVYKRGTLGSAMLLSRGLSFYLILLVSIVVLSLVQIKNIKKKN